MPRFIMWAAFLLAVALTYAVVLTPGKLFGLGFFMGYGWGVVSTGLAVAIDRNRRRP